jgi:hypothetical protein
MGAFEQEMLALMRNMDYPVLSFTSPIGVPMLSGVKGLFEFWHDGRQIQMVGIVQERLTGAVAQWLVDLAASLNLDEEAFPLGCAAMAICKEAAWDEMPEDIEVWVYERLQGGDDESDFGIELSSAG